MTAIEERYRAAILARAKAEHEYDKAGIVLEVQRRSFDDVVVLLSAARDEEKAARKAYEAEVLGKPAEPVLVTERGAESLIEIE